MARESIYRYMRPGFPKESSDEGAYRNAIEYVGPYIDIQAANCHVGIEWGNYPGRVVSAQAEKIEGTDYAILNVVVEWKFGSDDYGTAAVPDTVNYEEEWVLVGRSTLEHPEFAVGGSGSLTLTSEDVCAIDRWKNEEDVSKKKDFKYQKDAGGTYETLSANAKMFARGIQLGVETWDDFVPVIRKTSVFTGGIPPKESAGQKDNPPSEARGPSGYEWRKTGARRMHTGGQTRWELIEEWTGCEKVLLDKDQIFWTAP